MKKEQLKAEIEEHNEEIHKCQESIAYFYNKYVRKEGMPELTDEDFEKMKKVAANLPLKYRNKETYMKLRDQKPKYSQHITLDNFREK